MWGTAWETYGKTFAVTFTRYWPEDVELVIVTDRELPLERGRQVFLDDIRAYRAFMARYKDKLWAHGFDPPRDRAVGPDGRSWVFDAVKWAPQGVAPFAALDGMEDGDVFVWLDADVETTGPVRPGWVEELLDGRDVACLQRAPAHSEIGFYAFRISPQTRSVIRKFSDLYESGEVFGLREWHSAYVWDRSLESVKGLKVRNLTNPHVRVRKGHVWPHTALAEFTVHKKGKLKDAS